MKNQVVNPYLPQWEYVPDGEPHVFGDRVYVYGSHDRFGAKMFCVENYTCWSAPVDDLSDWRCEGTIFRKTQDPSNRMGLRLLFAPDCVQGADGRFYLYYAFDFLGQIGVAVADTPAGPFEHLGHVSWPDGTPYGRRTGDGFPFDPGVLIEDDGTAWLYTGFYTPVPSIASGFHKCAFDGGYVLHLQSDMLTITGDQKLLFPKEGPGSFEGHEFFEASSIRKYGDTYLFVYSSRLNHELCYATSTRPDGDFVYGGTLVSIGDVGLPGHTDEKSASNYTGNTHGGVLRIPPADDDGSDPFAGTWYVFYHRQTNRSSYARQACAERLVRDTSREGLNFLQSEVTSCGLNDGPLAGIGAYEARIACNLWSDEGAGRVDGSSPKRRLAKHPYFTQEGPVGKEGARQYIANMRHGATAGFKYFDLGGTHHISVTVRAKGQGGFAITADPDLREILGTVSFGPCKDWTTFEDEIVPAGTSSALYFRYMGEGCVDFLGFTLS